MVLRSPKFHRPSRQEVRSRTGLRGEGCGAGAGKGVEVAKHNVVCVLKRGRGSNSLVGPLTLSSGINLWTVQMSTLTSRSVVHMTQLSLLIRRPGLSSGVNRTFS